MFDINKSIESASTLQSDFYTSKSVFESLKEKVFAKSWHWITTENEVPHTGSVYPFDLYDRFLSEPLFFLRDKEQNLKCMSNVCTHRGNKLVQNQSTCKSIVCGYHGRRFNFNGEMEFMPEFDKAENFPCKNDNLHKIPFANFHNHLFTSLSPVFDFNEIADVMNKKIDFLPIDNFKLDANMSRDYLVNANWALYCDNYLEGFHIPFVHKDLNATLDYKNYSSEIYKYCNLQVGIADESTVAFDLPADHEDYGKRVAAYYFWLFPNMMFNFYPWGLSINVVKPLEVDKCKVSFYVYVYDSSKIEDSAGADIDKVEREDEAIVEAVQKGLRSRYYTKGRFSPTREQGVYHFHSLISEFMNK